MSDIAKKFDVLGWFSPSIVQIKILLQHVWELKVGWDDLLPPEIKDTWLRWRMELTLLSDRPIPRCHFPKQVYIQYVQLHRFSDASEEAYSGVVFLRMVDSLQHVHTSLVTSKTKVAPIKQLTIPLLELCGVHLLARLLHHVCQVFHQSVNSVFTWTDSMIVLSWLSTTPPSRVSSVPPISQQCFCLH